MKPRFSGPKNTHGKQARENRHVQEVEKAVPSLDEDELMAIIAEKTIKELKAPKNENVFISGLLHDVGKLGIRDNVLLKPGKLDEEEFTIMKTHVEHGLEITDRASWLKDAQGIVGGHHEKYDGAGYPAGLQGESIPLAARIFAITDVFDALTSRRPYKDPMSFDESIEILQSGRGSHFDPNLIDAFFAIAQDLYEEYSGKDDAKPKERLEAMTKEYFKRDIADLLG
jgi:HD-GYP domain-containing protein (c-di-GMP phosphodiesterase class II)